MSSERAMICRAAGQVGTLAGTATAVASSTTYVAYTTLPAQVADANLLALSGLHLLRVLCAGFVFWTSCDPRRRRATLGGCAVLAWLHMTTVALLQSMTHMYSLWGAAYLLAPAVSPLGSLALLALSYRGDPLGGSDEAAQVPAAAWLYGLALPLLLVDTLASWLAWFDLPGAFLVSVFAATAFYAGLRRISPSSCPAHWEPVAALMTSLAVLEYGLVLLLAALAPADITVSTGSGESIACASALALTLCLVALQLRAHEDRQIGSPSKARPRMERAKED